MGPELCLNEDGTPFLQLGANKLQLERDELEGEFLDRAKKELRESPENKSEAIGTLRKLLENEEGLVFPSDDTEFLLKFLRPCKFYADSTYRLMKRYYKFKIKYPKYSVDLVPSALKSTIDQGIAYFLPNRDKSGCRIMIIHIGSKWNPKTLKLQDMFRAIMMFIEVGMVEPKTQLAGVQVIFDMSGLSMNHVYQFGPSFALALLEWVQECIPLRLKGIHIINEPRIFNVLFAIFKPFINDKLRKRIFFHGNNFEKLTPYFGHDYLPLCYGGGVDIPEYPAELLSELFCHYEDEFQKVSSYGYNKQQIINNNE